MQKLRSAKTYEQKKEDQLKDSARKTEKWKKMNTQEKDISRAQDGILPRDIR